MADNSTLPASGDVIRDIDRGGIKTQVMALDAGGAAGESLVTPTNPLPTSINASIFRFSTNNTSSAELAAGATFPGAIETALDQPSISILLTSDQPITLTVYQYIDVGGVYAVPPIVYYVAAGRGFSASFGLNGNYIKVTAKNTGLLTTTTFELNTAYGTLPSTDPNGNLPTTHMGSGDYGGIALLEACIAGDLALTTQVINAERRDSFGASIPSDAPKDARINASVVGQQFIIDTQGYQTLSLSMGTMAATVTGCNDMGGTFGAVSCFPVVLGAPVTTAAAATNYIVPCFTRFIKLVVTTIGWAAPALRQQPLPVSYLANVPTNISQINGAATSAAAAQLGVALINVNAAVHSSTNPVYASPVAVAATNGQTIFQSIITATAAAVSQPKASAGRITMLAVSNGAANVGYLHLQNSAAATTATASVMTIAIPATAGAFISVALPDGGLYLSAGIAFTVSGALASADTTALTAPSIAVNLAYI